MQNRADDTTTHRGRDDSLLWIHFIHAQARPSLARIQLNTYQPRTIKNIMKYQDITAAVTALAMSSTIAFAAEDTQKSATATSGTSTATTQAQNQNQNQNPADKWLVDSSKLDGAAVWDFHGNKLGDLQQVLVDPKSGRVRYGVLEVDKAWNWSDPMIAIPWGTFAVKKGDGKTPTISIDSTKEKLEKAPRYKVGDAGRLYEKKASQPIYTYWGIYWIEDPTPTGGAGERDQNKPGNNTSGNPSSSSGSTDGTTPATPRPGGNNNNNTPDN